MTENVAIIGANPIVRLFHGDDVTIAASIWVIDWSIHGSGTAIVMWHDGRVHLISDNTDLATWLAEDFTRHFPEFIDLPWTTPTITNNPVTVTMDIGRGMTATAGNITITTSTTMDIRPFRTDSFTIDATSYGLSLIIAPQQHATITINNHSIPGVVTHDHHQARPSSSAFLTTAEVWTTH